MSGCTNQLAISRIEVENLGSHGYNAFLRSVAILGYYTLTVLLLFDIIVDFLAFIVNLNFLFKYLSG
jgi:hypothetical protein